MNFVPMAARQTLSGALLGVNSVSHRFCIRLSAVLLLGSVLTGLLAPAAVAMSRTDIVIASEQAGLSSDVQDFFSEILEDALLRSAIVAQLTAATSTRLLAPSRRLFVQSRSAVPDISETDVSLPSGANEDVQFLRDASTGLSGGGAQPLGP